MMTKERFIWLLQNSVKITTEKYPDAIFYYMDKNIERQIKLQSVLDINKHISLNLNKIDVNNILFEQDTKNKWLWIDYDNIWSKLESNIDYKDMDISKMISGWVKDDTNSKLYTPIAFTASNTTLLKYDTNWKLYTPFCQEIHGAQLLRYDTNWKLYISKKG